MFDRAIVKHMAGKFGLDQGEGKEFNLSWKVYSALVRDLSSAQRCAAQLEGEAQVAAAPGKIKTIVEGGRVDEVGYQRVRTLPTADRYVVFSDHHITSADHRNNFFIDKGNVVLYSAALRQYLEAGYTLIEDGDVEELIIFDPLLHPEALQERWDIVDGAVNVDEVVPQALMDHRIALRRDMLLAIIAEERLEPWRSACQAFDQLGRYVRIAGNHDYDLQHPDLAAPFQEVFPNVGEVADVVLLEGATGITHVVMHGHQFDRSANPVSASRTGETTSECLGIWYEGADRHWRWEDDGPKAWVENGYLLNVLVEDEISWSGKPCKAPVAGGLEPMGPVPPDGGQPDVETPAEPMDPALEAQLDALFAEVIEEMNADNPLEPMGPEDLPAEKDRFMQKLFEMLFNHNVAWEYFEHDKALAAILHEVGTGTRGFKHRHMDELKITQGLIDTFPDPDTRPTLVLGHSHEPRIQSLDANDEAVPFYLNTASAGRFAGLVWGMEIDHGVARLISWSRALDGTVERRVWTNGEGPRLLASDPIPLLGPIA